MRRGGGNPGIDGIGGAGGRGIETDQTGYQGHTFAGWDVHGVGGAGSESYNSQDSNGGGGGGGGCGGGGSGGTNTNSGGGGGGGAGAFSLGADTPPSGGQIISNPPTTAGSVHIVIDDVNPASDVVTLAVDGPVEGAWSSPVRNGDVTVTYGRDGRLPRSVTGRVVLDDVDGDGRAQVRFAIHNTGGTHRWPSGYRGVIRIVDSDGGRLTVPVRRGSIDVADDGTVSGRHRVRIPRRGWSTLTWSVYDADPKTTREQ